MHEHMFAAGEDGAATRGRSSRQAEHVSRLGPHRVSGPGTIDLHAERYFFATTIVLIVAVTPSTTSTTTM
jgi:hypothetical protein